MGERSVFGNSLVILNPAANCGIMGKYRTLLIEMKSRWTEFR